MIDRRKFDRIVNELNAHVQLEISFGADSYNKVVTPEVLAKIEQAMEKGAAEQTPPEVEYPAGAADSAASEDAPQVSEPGPEDNQEEPQTKLRKGMITGDPKKVKKLEALWQEFAECRKCQLGKTRQNLVFGVGTADARLMFIGEAPGADEDRQGEPFVGRAGKLLTKMIIAMGLSREEVFIGNILKCRPPENRVPTPDEMQICMPYLLRQIDIIKPEIICALGSTAVKGLFGDMTITIGKVRGKFIDWNGIKVMPTFHPSYLLRSPGEKVKVWSDLQLILKELGMPVPKKGMV